ncbi:unnamed protein product [Polarella glacialis]|uniref:Uncharacterized protein n=1 Tax=Polarella glacialis TaxID=89957 RepID=A0A813K6G3_POLGL|nr:unnamed protein product [Polarella glacialis]CAE8692304.1 unnamed protein product [Polarella glacialis]
MGSEAAGTADVHHINALTAAIARANQLLHSDPELSELCQSELVAAGGEGCPWLSVYEVVPMVSRMCGSVPVVSNLVQPSREEIKELFAGWAAETSNDGVLQAEFIKSFFKVVLQSCIHETEKRLADITGA